MRKSITLAALCLSLCCSSAADAIQPKDASYFCVAEIAGGIAYNELAKKWVGAVFKATQKMVLRLKFVDTQKGTLSYKPSRFKYVASDSKIGGLFTSIATPLKSLG
jgi:hypothetical protein